jgi:hypothetical protein
MNPGLAPAREIAETPQSIQQIGNLQPLDSPEIFWRFLC